MHPIIRTIRTIVPPVLVGLQALILASCESAQPLGPGMSPDSTQPRVVLTGSQVLSISAPDSSLTPSQQVQVLFSAHNPPDGAVRLTPNIAWSISSPANVATISTKGLITAGSVSGAATVSAKWEGVTATLPITVGSATTPQSARASSITITAAATQIKIGQSTQVTGVVKDKNGAVITNFPITWTTSPVAIATAATNTTTTGTIAGKGIGTATVYAKADTVTRQISITVIDSATGGSKPPTQPVPPAGTGTLNSIATLATLPQATVSTTYPTPVRQVRVAAGANLQAALNAAQPGDELLLAPGATFTGNFTLPAKGSSTAWITVRTDVPDATLGAPGTRMTPSRAASAKLAKILTTNNAAAIATTLTAHHWRLTGLEIGGTASAQEINGIVRFGDGSSAQNSLSLVAHDLVLDRSFVHGMSTQAVRRCISLQSATTALIDSWISDCHSNNGDSQAIVGWNGPGPYLISNNHLEGGHQGLFFGGADPAIANLSPSDITVIGNHITRPQAWKGIWQTKTIIESKNARRMLLEGNVIENTWPDAQAGYAILLKSENQNGTAPWTQSTDITVRYNIIQNIGNGMNIAANPSTNPAVPAARMTIVDNQFKNLGLFGGTAIPLQILGNVADVIIAHNTWSNAGSQAISFDAGANVRLVIHSNVIPNGAYGVKGSGTGVGNSTLTAYAPGSVFAYDVMVGATCTQYPATTICPATMPSSFSAGYDGRTIGPNMSQLNSKTGSVIVAP